ncbi:hypothetical protein FGO68_gene12870 [Halteria grandinella]|uniref:Uncharacterized protein n=1 Tax=Halteria grandinella TaxID=5974 RepID=A0A8J8NEX2_HALGN|nr:hypothetical protein FGO68_gene12870 [Halteria grandinella]
MKNFQIKTTISMPPPIISGTDSSSRELSPQPHHHPQLVKQESKLSGIPAGGGSSSNIILPQCVCQINLTGLCSKREQENLLKKSTCSLLLTNRGTTPLSLMSFLGYARSTRRLLRITIHAF